MLKTSVPLYDGISVPLYDGITVRARETEAGAVAARIESKRRQEAATSGQP